MVQAAQSSASKPGAKKQSAAAAQSQMAQKRFEFENAISDEQLYTWDAEAMNDLIAR